MLHLYWIQKTRNIKSENDEKEDSEVRLMNMKRSPREPVMYVERKSTGNKISLTKPKKLKIARLGSRVTAILMVRKGIKMLFIETKRRT